MLQIRKNIFETNSSSVHALTVVTEDDFEKFRNGEMWWDDYEQVILSKEEIIEQHQDDPRIRELPADAAFQYIMRQYSHQYSNFDNFDEGFDYMESHLVTPSGEKVVAFGYYGYDG